MGRKQKKAALLTSLTKKHKAREDIVHKTVRNQCLQEYEKLEEPLYNRKFTSSTPSRQHRRSDTPSLSPISISTILDNDDNLTLANNTQEDKAKNDTNNLDHGPEQNVERSKSRNEVLLSRKNSEHQVKLHSIKSYLKETPLSSKHETVHRTESTSSSSSSDESVLRYLEQQTVNGNREQIVRKLTCTNLLTKVSSFLKNLKKHKYTKYNSEKCCMVDNRDLCLNTIRDIIFLDTTVDMCEEMDIREEQAKRNGSRKKSTPKRKSEASIQETNDASTSDEEQNSSGVPENELITECMPSHNSIQTSNLESSNVRRNKSNILNNDHSLMNKSKEKYNTSKCTQTSDQTEELCKTHNKDESITNTTAEKVYRTRSRSKHDDNSCNVRVDTKSNNTVSSNNTDKSDESKSRRINRSPKKNLKSKLPIDDLKLVTIPFVLIENNAFDSLRNSVHEDHRQNPEISRIASNVQEANKTSTNNVNDSNINVNEEVQDIFINNDNGLNQISPSYLLRTRQLTPNKKDTRNVFENHQDSLIFKKPELPTNVRWLRSTQKNINLQKESEQNSHVIEENSLYLNTKQRTRRYYNNTSNLQASSSSSQNISNDPNLDASEKNSESINSEKSAPSRMEINDLPTKKQDSSKLTSLDKTQTKNMNKKKTIKGKSKISINKKKAMTNNVRTESQSVQESESVSLQQTESQSVQPETTTETTASASSTLRRSTRERRPAKLIYLKYTIIDTSEQKKQKSKSTAKKRNIVEKKKKKLSSINETPLEDNVEHVTSPALSISKRISSPNKRQLFNSNQKSGVPVQGISSPNKRQLINSNRISVVPVQTTESNLEQISMNETNYPTDMCTISFYYTEDEMRCGWINIKPNGVKSTQSLDDHQLVLTVVRGSGKVIIDNKIFPLKTDLCHIVKKGQMYHIRNTHKKTVLKIHFTLVKVYL